MSTVREWIEYLKTKDMDKKLMYECDGQTFDLSTEPCWENDKEIVF